MTINLDLISNAACRVSLQGILIDSNALFAQNEILNSAQAQLQMQVRLHRQSGNQKYQFDYLNYVISVLSIELVNEELLLTCDITSLENKNSRLASGSFLSSAFCDVLDSLSDGMILCNGEGEISFFNRQAKNFFQDVDLNRFIGGSLERAIGFLIYSECQEHIYDYEELIYLTHQKKSNSLPTEFQLVTDRGVVYQCHHNITPSGLRLLAIIDNSYTQQLTEQFDNAYLQASNLSEAKSHFMAAMGHEIRTPLNAIIGLLDLTIDDAQFKGNLNIKTIHRSAHQLLDLLNDVLDFTKFEAGKITLDLIPCNLQVLCENVIESFSSGNSPEKDAWLSLYFDPSIPIFIQVDELRLTQVLSNLISNAIKFQNGQTGKVILHVTLKADLQEGAGEIQLRFKVVDNGIGISEEDQLLIFERFSQANKHIHGQFGGTGLGLNISQNICHLMGSELHVESKLGHGATFYFDVTMAVFEAQKVEYAQLRQPTRQHYYSNSERFVEALGFYTQYFNFSVEYKKFTVDFIASEFDWFFINPSYLTADELSFLEQYCPSQHNIAILLDDSLPVELKNYPVFYQFPIRLSALNQLIENPNEYLLLSKTNTEHTLAYLDLSQLTVLVVEDNSDNTFVIDQQLRSFGVHADFYDQPKEAVNAFQNKRYDVIISDYQMPGLTGAQFTEKIRKIEFEQERDLVTIAVLTADKTNECLELCLEAGADEVFIKPFSRENIYAFLEQVLLHSDDDFMQDNELFLNGDDDGWNIGQSHHDKLSCREPFDLSVISQFVGDIDPKTSTEFLTRYIGNMKERLFQIEAESALDNFAQVKKLAHNLKSSALYIGAKQLNCQCQQLENVLSATPINVELYADLVEKIIMEVAKIIELLEKRVL